MAYKQTLKNSGARFNYGRICEYPSPLWRHRAEECESFAWDSYDGADEYGSKCCKSGYTVTACQFCGKWHCKSGAPRPTGIVREGGK